jgi:hypothetical protein
MQTMKKLIISGLAACLVSIVYAQNSVQVKIDVDDPKFEGVDTPDFSVDTKSKKWKQKEWLEMEVKFEIEAMKPMPRDKTLPKLTVKWFVVAVDPTKGGKNYIRLTKEVKHVNIPVGEEIFTSCYISPSGVRRLSNGGDNASKRIIFGVGGEFYIDNKLVAFFASEDNKVTVNGKKMPFWYSPSLSESNSVQIHDKNETPFKFLWWDRYAEIESKENKAAPPEEGN